MATELDGLMKEFEAVKEMEDGIGKSFLLYVLLKKVQALKAAGGGVGLMPESAVKSLVDAVPDELVRGIVGDQYGTGRGVFERGGFGAPGKGGAAEPVVKGSGWVKPVGLEGSVPGVKWVDQLCDVQDAVDKVDNARRLGVAGKLVRRM